MMNKLVEVWCWVRGSPLLEVFPIEASLDATLKVVEERVKDSWSRRSGSDGNSEPILYKAPDNIPDISKDTFADCLGALTFSALGPSLRITRSKTISNIFTPSFFESDRLCFIIDYPIYPITYWIRGGDITGDITIGVCKYVFLGSILKTEAKKSWKPFEHVSSHDLAVYGISFKDKNELNETLQRLGEGDAVPPNQSVWDAFSILPFSSTMLNFVVQLVENQVHPIPPSSHTYLAGEGTNFLTVESERSKFLDRNKKQRPSAVAAPSTFVKRQNSLSHYIPCGRPREREDLIPLTLLHPIFAQLKEDMRDIPLTAEDNAFIIRLANAMSKIYLDESYRVEAVKRVLKGYGIHLSVSKTEAGGYEPDGDLSVNGHRHVLVECKNEVGCTAKEPYFQGIAYYLEFTRQDATRMWHSSLPCLLISIYGSNIDIFAIAWNLRPSAQLLGTLAFHLHSTDIDDLLMLARHMAAFRKASKALSEYYGKLEPPSPSSTPPPQLFPFPTIYISRITKESVKIVYKMQKSEHQLVFFGREGSDSGPAICIKFTRRYSDKAHECCVSFGCAPTLRGFQPIPGGWFMVVMDDISNEYETLYGNLFRISTKALIVEKLSKFHGEGFVHGDLRDTNIMVSKSNGLDFKFIDFDWAGLQKHTYYPPFMNRELERPSDAQDLLPILPRHDHEMLELIPCQ